MKQIMVLVIGLLAFGAQAKTTSATEMWKGESPANQFTGGISAGMAFNGPSSVGGIFTGNIAARIVDRGFVPDINDQVFVELQGGPEFFSRATIFTGSLALRWDFHRDYDLSLFATGGLGTRLGTGLTQFFPHLGLGLFWHLEVVDIRAELSQNWLQLGASLPF